MRERVVHLKLNLVSGRGELLYFFFQAEDGIRDLTVTGVQTCALPIYAPERDRRGKAGQVADDAAAERHQGGAALDPGIEQAVDQVFEPGEALGFLAG